MPSRGYGVEMLEERTLLAVTIPTQLVLGPSYDLTLEAATAAPDGSLIVAGNFGLGMDMDPRASALNIPTTGQRTWFVSKYSRQGTPIWVKTVDVANQDQTHLNIQAIATDVAGNIYLGGNLNGPFDFDPGTASRVLTPVAGAMHELTADTFLWKLNARGEYVFAKLTNHISTANEEVFAIAIDRYGNPYLSGAATPMDPQTSSPSGATQPFITKYSPTGQVAWSRNHLAHALVIGADDGAWLAAGGDALNVTHLTPLGKYKSYFRAASSAIPGSELPQIRVNSIDTDAAGNLVMAGSFRYRYDFAPNNATPLVLGPRKSNPFRDIFVSKYTPAGQNLLGFSIGTPLDDDNAFAARVDKPSGNIYLAGDFSDKTDFDPSRTGQHIIDAGSPLLVPSSDAFVARYTARGRFASVYSFHTTRADVVHGLALTPGPLTFIAYENFNPDSELSRVYLDQPNLLT